MKIVMSTDNYWPRVSGVGTSVDSFKLGLTQLGHEVFVFASEYPMTEEQKKTYDNDHILRFKSSQQFFSPEDHLVKHSEKNKVFEALDRIKPDIIHIQTEFAIGTLMKAYCKARNIPILMSCHTYFEQYIKFYFPWMPKFIGVLITRFGTRMEFMAADRIIVPSGLMRDVLRKYKIDKPITIIPTGLIPEDFQGPTKENEKQNSDLFQQFPYLKGKKTMLFVGRVGKEKNVDFLVPVMRKVREKVKDVVLMVAGGGPFLEEMKKTSIADGMENNYAFLGYIPRNKIKSVYTLADVLAFPSKSETQGLVSIESMLCKTPVVALGFMGTREVMNGDNGGYMVPDDVDVFSSRVIDLLTNESLYRKKSDEAFQYAQNWTYEKMTKKMLAEYEEIMKLRKARTKRTFGHDRFESRTERG